MTMIEFKSKKHKDHLLNKTKKMKEYVDDILECLENSDYEYDDYDYDERRYKDEEEHEMRNRYNYRRMR